MKNKQSETSIKSLPKKWRIAELKELGLFKKGKGIRKDQVQVNGFPCIRYGELYTHHHDVIVQFHSYISEAIAKESQQLKQGDILFAGSGETKEEIGKCAAFLGQFEAYAGGDIVILSPDQDSADSQFLGYLLNSPAIVRQKASKGQGDAVVHINATNLAAIQIPLPPLPEQRAIAAALSDVDALLRAQDRLIAKKEAVKQGVMQALLSGKERLPGFEREKGYKKCPLGQIPSDWITSPLIEVADPQKKWSFIGGPFGSNLKSSDYTSQGVRIIQLQNIGDGEFLDDYKIFTSEKKADQLISNNIFPGEIILSKMGDPVARAAIIPSSSSRYVMCSDGIRLAVDKKEFSQLFVFYFINSRMFRYQAEQASTGSTRKRIGLSSLKELLVYKPSLAEQRAIATVLSDLDAELAALRARRAKYARFKEGMMQELLTGRTRLV